MLAFRFLQKDTTVAVLGPGEYFGEIALLTNKPRQVSQRCILDYTSLDALDARWRAVTRAR